MGYAEFQRIERAPVRKAVGRHVEDSGDVRTVETECGAAELERGDHAGSGSSLPRGRGKKPFFSRSRASSFLAGTAGGLGGVRSLFSPFIRALVSSVDSVSDSGNAAAVALGFSVLCVLATVWRSDVSLE